MSTAHGINGSDLQPFDVTFFFSFGADRKREARHTLESLADEIRVTTAPEKARLPWLKLAKFGDHRSDKNSLRHDPNVLAVTGIEADYDGEVIPYGEAVETLTKAGISGIVYTSPSHTAERPRWRVVCPLSEPVTPERRAKVLGRLNGLFRGALSAESWALSQSYYYGSVARNPAHQVDVIDGEPIDTLDELDRIWQGKPHTASTANGSAAGHSGAVDEAALLDEIVSGRSYHAAAVRLLGKWARDGVSYMDARTRLISAMESVFPPDRDARWRARRDDVDRCLEGIYGKDAAARDAEAQAAPEPAADPVDGATILSSVSPLRSARVFVEQHHTAVGLQTLHHQNGAFYAWTGTHYVESTAEEMRARLYDFLDRAKSVKDGGKPTPFNPNRSKVANVLEATAATVQLPLSIRAPAWLDQGEHPDPNGIIACTNVLLDLPTRRTRPHTPAFFTLNALDFDYDPAAPEPANWLAFLKALWPDDEAAIKTLQEMFGLLLTGETKYQKAFLMVGPARSGKGTIARVLTRLLGAANVAGPTLSSLGQNFGLEGLVGKRLAVISDARLSGKTDQQVIVERVLAITGEDSITVDRKFRTGWTGKLDARFVILTNELPRLTDSSGALASRFIILTMTRSFLGKEDLGLMAKLVPELPGILAWAIAGWERLTRRQYFVTPASSLAAQMSLEDLGSPISAFLREQCSVGPGKAVGVAELYQSWCAWCGDQGNNHPGTVQTFGRDLGAAVAGSKVGQQRQPDGSRKRVFSGLSMKTREDTEREDRAKDDLARDGTRSTAL